jgi:hypothetical protein
MKAKKKLGIWMDHSTANIMELFNYKILIVTLDSTPAFPDRIEDLRMDERLMHNKEQNMESDFYEKLSSIIMEYNDVLLFGPTKAKTELFNRLRKNRRFEDIHISVETTGKITEHQQQAFLKQFYNKKAHNA